MRVGTADGLRSIEHSRMVERLFESEYGPDVRRLSRGVILVIGRTINGPFETRKEWPICASHSPTGRMGEQRIEVQSATAVSDEGPARSMQHQKEQQRHSVWTMHMHMYISSPCARHAVGDAEMAHQSVPWMCLAQPTH